MREISICIPTYNRAKYLDQALKSIADQIDIKNRQNIEVVVSDDNSKDNTREVVAKYKDIINIVYHRNKQNLGLVKNLTKVATYAKGKYVWFFGDDDWLKNDAIDRVISVLRSSNYDVIYCNVDMYSNTSKEITKKNLFSISKDISIASRREFFNFLNTKFIYTIDWFTTYYSSLIVRKELFDQSLSNIMSHQSFLDVYPHMDPVFFNTRELKVYILSESIILYRAGNTSWGPRGIVNFLKFFDKSLVLHYRRIYLYNKDYLPHTFRYYLFLKTIIRKARILFLKLRNILIRNND
jgi:abequosyltransferase